MVNTPTPTKRSQTPACPGCCRSWRLCQCETKQAIGYDSITNRSRQSGDSENEVGTIVAGKYEIIRNLGGGGMGSIYLAEHVTLGKKFALKIMRKELVHDEVIVKRLQREAQACGSLKHPNIVPVYDLGITENCFPYMVMEYLEGEDLESLIAKNKGLSVKQVMKLATEICAGLAYAHEHGVIHRDLKPTNVFVVNPGTDHESIKIVDFGIAKVELPGGEMQHLTQTGEVLGSPSYMSPEQIAGQTADQRSDIYSFGCVLYEMIVGKQLFRGETLMSTLQANLDQVPANFATLESVSKHSEPIYNIMRRCVEKDPTQRYPSMRAVNDALDRIGRKRQRKKQMLIGAALISFCLLFGTFAILLFPSNFREDHKTAKSALPSGGDTKESRSVSSSGSNKSRSGDLIMANLLDEVFSNEPHVVREFEKIFETAQDPNLKLTAAYELIDEWNSELKNRLRLGEDDGRIVANAEQMLKKVDAVIAGYHDHNFDTIYGAQAYYQFHKTMYIIAEHRREQFKRQYKVRSSEVASDSFMCQQDPGFRNAIQKSAEATRRAIQIGTMSSDGSVILAHYHRSLGKDLLSLGHKHEAVKELTFALEMREKVNASPEEIAESHEDLARALAETRRYADACEHNRMAIECLSTAKPSGYKGKLKRLRQLQQEWAGLIEQEAPQ